MKSGFLKKSLVALTVLTSALVPLSSYAESPMTGGVINDPSLNPEINAKLIAETNKKDALAEAWYKGERVQKLRQQQEGDARSLLADEHYEVNATNFQQETGYWCGPAAVRQTLSFHKSKVSSSTALPSQTTLASAIGTTVDGSATTGITSALNSYSSTFGPFTYISSDVTDATVPLDTFRFRITFDLDGQSNAPILLIDSRDLPRYGGTYVRHYVTASGYKKDSTTEEIRTVDPNNNNSYYGIYWDPMGDATTNGVFKSVQRADLAGTNKAMSW